jgi:chromosomal replication initiation ATPase DnaA
MWQVCSHASLLPLEALPSFDARSSLAKGGALLLDDADKLAGDAEREEALFHIYNLLNETKGHLLLTAKTAPAQWGLRLADLRSRLSSVPAIMLGAPDDELISALLVKQFTDRQISITADVIDYLVPRIERTPSAIRTIVDQLDKISLAENRRITVSLARRLIDKECFPPS